MPASKPLPALGALLAVLCTALAVSAQAAPSTTRSSSESAILKAVLRSRDLWATIDVCSPADQPDTVGIRGSMPGDKQAHDQMYMSFRLQYQDAKTKKWLDLPGNPKPNFLHVGAGASVRQGGRSFQLQPQAGKPAFTLRGVVDFQWRRGSRVLQTATRPTSAGHKSLAGADPAGFASASCLIG
jgi:hypothetical protein